MEAYVMQFKAVLLDFDYTLADSSQGVIDCIGFALGELGLAPVPDDAACRTIGLTLPDTLRVLAGPQPAWVSAQFSQRFVEQAERVMVDKTVLLPGVREALAQLQAQGLVLGIVSTKYRRRIETTLQRDRLIDPFAVIVGGEDVLAHKPDPESLWLAMGRLGVRPEETLYVGDSLSDAEAAERAGVPFAAVLSGKTSQEAFTPYASWAVVDELAELVERIRATGMEEGR
jgi:phosphoglycolate phosphatase